MSDGRGSACPVVHGSPVEADSGALPVYDEAFAADPGGFVREARRRFGPLVPVELAPGVPATMVVGYNTALQIQRNPDQFPADPRAWEQGVAAGCPVAPFLEFRPTPARTAHAEHARLRRAHVDVLDRLDQHALRSAVERVAVPLINRFCGAGEAELRAQFAWPLVFEVVNRWCGVSSAAVLEAVAAATDAAAAAAGRELLDAAAATMVREKQAAPGEDLVSWLIGHPAGLCDEELVAQVALIYEMSIEPSVALIVNTLRLMLTDDQVAGHILGGALSTRDALEEVLFTDPPVATTCVTYPRGPQLIGGRWLPANQPVVINLAACNSDPAVQGIETGGAGGERFGNRSHLAFGTGIHACPAIDIALLIATCAVDQLMDALPDMRLVVPDDQLTRRPGLFQRGLTALPVAFPPAPPMPAPL